MARHSVTKPAQTVRTISEAVRAEALDLNGLFAAWRELRKVAGRYNSFSLDFNHDGYKHR